MLDLTGIITAVIGQVDFADLQTYIWTAAGFIALTIAVVGPLSLLIRNRRANAEALRMQEIEERQLKEAAEAVRQQSLAARTQLALRLGLSSAFDLAQITIQHVLDAFGGTEGGTEFEYFICNVLTLHGFQDVQHVGRPWDGGMDFTCRDQQGRLVIGQCKRYGLLRSVDRPTVEEFFFRAITLHPDRPDRKGLVVTTSTFTAPAREFEAASTERLELTDGKALVKIIRNLALPLPDAPSAPPAQPLIPAA